MFNTKFEVDKHVENCLKKVTNEKERNNRSYTFAKLYYNVGDYELCRRYVSSYLTVKPKSPEGHYLLGVALEKLGKKDAALDAYRTSLQLDPKQNNLVLKVCELLANDELYTDIASAKYFCELAENVDPYNPSIYNLKEKMIFAEGKNPDNVIKLLLKELENRPTDVNLRIRLIRNFVQNDKINEAYKHVHDVETKNLSIFSNNLTWYDVVCDVLIRHKRQSTPGNLSWSFWCLFVSVIDKSLALRLDERSDNPKESSEYVNQLFAFDQSLSEASRNIGDCPDRQLAREFLEHYRGQLYFHYATTIFKQAKKELIPFKEAAAITLPLLFVAYHSKPIDLRATWIDHLDESLKKFAKRWHREGGFRCSQTGHTLVAAALDRKSVVLTKAAQHSSGMWKEQLFKKIFVIREQQLKLSSSYFVTNHVDIHLKLPTEHELIEFDEESFYVFPDSLHHYVWVSLNNQRLADLNFAPFLGLQYSVKNLSNCGAETLNLLDVQAFIYCATLCAKVNRKSSKHILYYDVDRPGVLPEAVTGQLGTVEQSKFIMAAFKMYKNEPGCDSGELRVILIRGIETVRCVGRHGLDVSLLVKLAEIFAAKSNKCKKQSKIEFNDARAEIYWKSALPLLEKMKNNQAVTYATNRIFDCKAKDLSMPQICDFIDHGKLFLGELAMKRKEHEKALSIFEELKDPYASYHQGQIYKQMADRQMNQNKENVTSEMRSQNVILLSKARDCFYLTLDRLREPAVDRNHLLNAQLGGEIEKIERLLSRIDPDCVNRNECDGMSDDNMSSADSAEHYTSANYTTQFSTVYGSPYVSRNDTRNNHSTPLRFNVSRKEARPSPERLDAQLRQLIASKDATMGQVLEQNKIMLDSHRCLVDELRGFKEAVYNLSGQVDNLKTMKSSLEEIKDIKRSIDELKNSVDELQNFRNVTDIVYELKKEIANLKKDTSKHHPTNNDDIYVIDDDYPEYNISGNMNYNPAIYPNYPNRLQPTVPPALYPHGIYPPMYGSIQPYAYPNLAMAQSALAFGADQQLPPDLRGLTQPNSLYGATQPLGQNIQPPLNLTTANINPSLLMGQGLSQVQTQPNIFKDATPAVTSASISTAALSTTKSAPVNVVITSSDPLPALKSSVSQPILSVTIPPQHIKGSGHKTQQPHNYQIPLPTSTVTSTPSVLCKPAPAIATEGMLSNVAPPVYSAVLDNKSEDLGLQIEKSLEENFTSSRSKSPQPPAEQIDPNESVVFECPAKLYVFSEVNKQFKEKGSGIFNLLEDKNAKIVRVLMKEDNGKVLANHYVTKDTNIASTKDNAYYWSAPNYFEGRQTIEKQCVKFKNADDAKKFYEAFDKCKQTLNDTAVSSAPTTTFGGFVFTSSPIFKPKDPETATVVKPAVAVVENKTKSPFQNFSFGKNGKTVAMSTLVSTPSKQIQEQSKSPDTSLTDDFVPTAEFQPVIPLPDIVEVKTGEEEAEVLFSCRSKLLRFDAEKKEWKERGLGNMKILKEKTLIRLLMRREQIHKVCCNHQLLKSMNFRYMPNNLKAIMWCAQDFADEVMKSETFAIKFKTEEQAGDFMKCVLNAQTSLNDDNGLEKEEKKTRVNAETIKQNAMSQGFGDKFKPPKGSWPCNVCYITNDGGKPSCAACGTLKPSSTKNVKDVPVEPKAAEVTTKVAVSGWGDAFKPKPGSWECQSCLVRNDSGVLYCASCDSPKDDTIPKKDTTGGLKGINLETSQKFNFGFGAINAPAAEPAKPETPATFKFGSTTSSSGAATTFGFGATTDLPATFSFKPPTVQKTEQHTSNAVQKSESFVFGSPAAHDFDFHPRSPRKSLGAGDEESEGSYLEEELDTIYFKPVIPLPDKVEVKTGEENEEVVYCHRAKLFRFAAGEWKERGVGDLKILRNKETNKLRILMRRDQVLKICLNHALTTNIEYRLKDEKTWLFAAADFSEGEVSHDQFCIRFKTSEIAQNFKEAVDAALKKSLEKDRGVQLGSSDDDDVEFVSETTATSEELKEAQKFSLPSQFFAYRRLPPCSCVQCSKDDEYFKGTILEEAVTPAKKDKDGDVKSDSSCSEFHTPTMSGKGESLRNLLLIPQNSAESSSSIVVTPVSSTTTIAGNLFGSKFGTNLFGSKPASVDNSAIKSFSFTAKVPENASVATSTTSLFSNSSTTDNKSSIFSGSGTSIFGNNIFSTKSTTNVFGTPTTILFGSPSSITTNASSIFGSNTSTTPSARSNGTEVLSTPKTDANPFGPINTGSLFSGASAGGLSLFSSGAKFQFGKGESIFGQAKENVSPANPLFGGIGKGENASTADLKEDDEVVLKCSVDVSFASLAQQNKSVTPAFDNSSDGGGDIKPFAFLGAGTPVFGSNKNQEISVHQLDSTQDEGQEDSAAVKDEEYDPYYEPIVPMPDAIVVSTGEEEEKACFNERAKLFRYDDDLKEWKERGVGQLKILHHPSNGTYRFLLRREQVHKIVLNQLITPNLELQPMMTSDKAWVWAGHNYVEEQMYLEKLAIRFKYQATAQKFFEAVQDCMASLKELQNDSNNLPATIQNYGVDDISCESDAHDETYEQDYDDEDDDYHYDDYEDKRNVIFSRACKLEELTQNGQWIEVSEGEIQIHNDPENCLKISFFDTNGELRSNSVIGMNTVMTLEGKVCTWKTVELANEEMDWRDLRAVFDSTDIAGQFHESYLEALSHAQEWEILDDIPGEIE